MKLILVLFLGLILSNCQTKKSPQDSQVQGLVITTGMRKSSVVTVCIVNPEVKDKFPNAIETIKNAVVTEYGKSNEVRFVGWEPCVDAQKELKDFTLRYYIADKSITRKLGGESHLGPSVNPLYSNLELCNSCNIWTIFYPDDLNRSKFYALHEFGHAIGMVHEHNRKDNTDNCSLVANDQKVIFEDDFYRYVGSFNKRSIMNYCADVNDYSLDDDVDAINFLYNFVKSENMAIRINIEDLGNNRFKTTGNFAFIGFPLNSTMHNKKLRFALWRAGLAERKGRMKLGVIDVNKPDKEYGFYSYNFDTTMERAIFADFKMKTENNLAIGISFNEPNIEAFIEGINVQGFQVKVP